MKKIEDKIFLIVLVTIMLGGLIKPILMPKNISYLENREANQIPKFKLADILNKTYQDDFELALADQIPLSERFKLANKSFNTLLKIEYSKINKSNYLHMGGVIYLNDNYLIYGATDLNYITPQLNEKIANFNSIIENNNELEYYLYYIEKDTDIKFKTEEKTEKRTNFSSFFSIQP